MMLCYYITSTAPTNSDSTHIRGSICKQTRIYARAGRAIAGAAELLLRSQATIADSQQAVLAPPHRGDAGSRAVLNYNQIFSHRNFRVGRFAPCVPPCVADVHRLLPCGHIALSS